MNNPIAGIGQQTLDSDSESMTLLQCAKMSNHFSIYFFKVTLTALS